MSDLCPVAVEATHWKGSQPNTVAEANLCLLTQKRLCDVIFTFENPPDQIEAHQFCLRARSPVFDSMLRGRGSFGERRAIKITNATPERFQQFLEFIYADKFEANLPAALDLLQLAHQYKVEPLITKCEAVLKSEVQVSEALEVFQAANSLGNLEDLKEKAADIMARALETLGENEKFLRDMQEETLTYLLKRDVLPLKEVELFKLALRWGERRLQADENGNNEALKKVLSKIIPLLRCITMTPQEFTTVVLPTQLLSPEEVIDVYAYLCGDASARAQVVARRSFNALARRTLTGAVVHFCKETSGHYDVQGNSPLNECISFYSKLLNSTLKGKVKKQLAIVGILLRWPTRTVAPVSSAVLNSPLCFTVSLRRFKSSTIRRISDNYLDCKFETTVRICTPGELTEIFIEPPINLLNHTDYCVTLQDDYNLHGNDNSAGSVKFQYSWQTKLTNLENPIQAIVDNLMVEFHEVKREKNLPGFPDKVCSDVLTIRGIRIAAI